MEAPIYLVILLIAVAVMVTLIQRKSEMKQLQMQDKLEQERLDGLKGKIEAFQNLTKHLNEDSELLNQKLFDALYPHLEVLVRKYRQTMREDDYGKVISKDWEKELDYFVDEVGFDDEIFSLISTWVTSYRWAVQDKNQLTQGEVYTEEDLLKMGVDSSDIENSLYEAIKPIRNVGPNEEDFIIQMARDNLDFYCRHFYRFWVWDTVWMYKHMKDQEDSEITIQMQGNTGHDYEMFCKEILNRAGWTVTHRGGSGDQGVDLIGELNGYKVVFQCKWYSSPVGNRAVQELISGMQFEGITNGAVITNSTYTTSAKQLANTANNVFLLHHEQLEEFTQAALETL